MNKILHKVYEITKTALLLTEKDKEDFEKF